MTMKDDMRAELMKDDVSLDSPEDFEDEPNGEDSDGTIDTGLEGCESTLEDTAVCLECGKVFAQDTDLQLCPKCMKLFDTDRLWKMHDNNELDALDFNESKEMRERFRIKVKYYRIFNTLTKKYVRQENKSYLVFEYPIQGDKYIERYLKGSRVYKVVEFKR